MLCKLKNTSYVIRNQHLVIYMPQKCQIAFIVYKLKIALSDLFLSLNGEKLSINQDLSTMLGNYKINWDYSLLKRRKHVYI